MTTGFETKIEDIREVSIDRQYWLIRTYSGKTFDDFLKNNYIGIGLNQVPNELITSSKSVEKKHIVDLINYLEKNSHYKGGEATKMARHLIRFQSEIKIGDIVMIPNHGSKTFAIGEITSNVKVVQDSRRFKFNKNYEAFPEKRRSVNWLTKTSKSTFKKELGNVFLSHQVIVNINDIGEVLESNISSLYLKDNIAHLFLEVNQGDKINAFQFNRFLSGITFFYNQYCIDNGLEEDEELYIKIKVQSPGLVALAGLAIGGIILIGALVVLSGSDEFTLELKEYGKIKSKRQKGFLKALSEFLDSNQERKQKALEFQESIKNLKADRQKALGFQKDASNSIEKKGERDEG